MCSIRLAVVPVVMSPSSSTSPTLPPTTPEAVFLLGKQNLLFVVFTPCRTGGSMYQSGAGVIYHLNASRKGRSSESLVGAVYIKPLDSINLPLCSTPTPVEGRDSQLGCHWSSLYLRRSGRTGMLSMGLKARLCLRQAYEDHRPLMHLKTAKFT